MKMKITINGTTATAILYENATARAFAALLPIELELEDYNQIEKIAELSADLPTAGAPSGYHPSVGDITYYEPWGNLAFFYREFGYSNGLVSVGRITSGIEVFTPAYTIKARLERYE